MAKSEMGSVRRRDWEDPMTVEWNKCHAHVPLHCHTTIEGESLDILLGIEILVSRLGFWEI